MYIQSLISSVRKPACVFCQIKYWKVSQGLLIKIPVLKMGMYLRDCSVSTEKTGVGNTDYIIYGNCAGGEVLRRCE